MPPGELAAEPVPELREALNPRDDEVVMLTGACHGLIDAPRRWRKSFAWDTRRSCRHEPCLMTWHDQWSCPGSCVPTDGEQSEMSLRMERMGTTRI